MLAFSLCFSAPLLVLCPSLCLVHSLSRLLPLSCGLSSHVPSLFPAPSLHMLAVSPAAILPHTMGFIPSFYFPFLWLPFPMLSLSCLLSCPCPCFVTPLLISLHLIFLVPSLSHVFTLCHSLAHQLHLLFPMCLLPTHSCASSCTHSLSIPLCSLFLRETLLLIPYLCLMLSFLSSPTLIHSSSRFHTFCLSPLLPHLFVSSSHSLLCMLALPCALTFSCVLPHSSHAFSCAPLACIVFLTPS